MIRVPLSRIRLVYRRSSPIVKCVVLAAIVLSTAALLTLRISITEAKAQTNDLRQQAAVIEQENQALEQNIEELDTVQGVKNIATDELGLADPDTTFFTPVEPDIPD